MSVVKYLQGFVFGRKGNPILSQQEAWSDDYKCGCGIECCKEEAGVRMPDRTDSGSVEIYVDGGDLFLKDASGTVYEITKVAV